MRCKLNLFESLVVFGIFGTAIVLCIVFIVDYGVSPWLVIPVTVVVAFPGVMIGAAIFVNLWRRCERGI